MIYLTLKQAQQIVESFGGDEETVMVLGSGEGHSGNGVYLGVGGYNEEGSFYLGEEKAP